MKRLAEIFKYGDSESVEILLSIFMLIEITCLSAKIEHIDYLAGFLIASIIISSGSLIISSFLLNCNLRKKSSYINFICIVGLLIYLISNEVGEMSYYILFGLQALGFIWIAWKNAIEEKWRKLPSTSKHK